MVALRNLKGLPLQLRVLVLVFVILASVSILHSGRIDTRTAVDEIWVAVPQTQTLRNTKDEFSSTTQASRMEFPDIEGQRSKLPRWMRQYMSWHSKQLMRIHNGERMWREQNLLVVRCLNEDRCGGTADRLKSLPLYLAAAAKTQRLLFLRWTRPFALESFLVPGDHLNWTVPASLAPLLDNSTSQVLHGGKALKPLVRSTYNNRIWLVEGAAQMTGGTLFNDIVWDMTDTESATAPNGEIEEPITFFHDMFLTLFRPAKALRELIDQQMNALDLRPNEFVTAHIRAKYPGEPYRETWNLTLLQQSVTNAVQCASSLGAYLPNLGSKATNGAVYVASDTLAALEAAQSFGKTTPYRVVSHLDVKNQLSDSSEHRSDAKVVLRKEDPPHLNFAKEEDPSAFFSIFADLFLMSQSKCVAFGAGGFGRFGSLLSFNATCRMAHSKQGKMMECLAPG